MDSVIQNNPHKVFVEKLKKQVSSDTHSPGSDSVSSSTTDEDVCSDEIMRELEAKFDQLFANLSDDD